MLADEHLMSDVINSTLVAVTSGADLEAQDSEQNSDLSEV